MEERSATRYEPPTIDEWWAIVDRLNSIDIGAAILEGGGAACTFIMIETNEGELINLGDVNETWTADWYASLSDWQNGQPGDSFDTKLPTSNRNADDIAAAYLAAWAEWLEE